MQHTKGKGIRRTHGYYYIGHYIYGIEHLLNWPHSFMATISSISMFAELRIGDCAVELWSVIILISSSFTLLII
jgi:hypothetical protein